jgi:catechol 2,3-dioxygenase-like lactoylglutathione lyase family enzyme
MPDRKRLQMAEFPGPKEGIVLTHFVVSNDVERSRRFYTDVLGGELVLEGEPSTVALANGWIIINVGGAPTDDKPTVTLEAPGDPDLVSSFLNIRVADIEAIYSEWSAPGGGVPYAAEGSWNARSGVMSATRTGI